MQDFNDDMTLAEFNPQKIPEDEWLRGEKRAMIDGTCYCTTYTETESGETIFHKYEVASRKNPKSNLRTRKDYKGEYNVRMDS